VRKPDKSSSPTEQLPNEILVILQRVTLLNEKDQFLAYEAIRDYLKAGSKVTGDPEIDERAESLHVLQAVAEHYGLADARTLAVRQFDEAPEALREGWGSSRVIRVWKRWRFAQDALAGAHARPTAKQRDSRRALGVGRLMTDDYLASVRDWLATKPASLGTASYNAWRKEQNQSLAEGQLPRPVFQSVQRGLGLTWANILEVARGHFEIADVPVHMTTRGLAEVSGPHQLVAFVDVVEITGANRAAVFARLKEPGAPVPVVLVGGKTNTRLWLREDIEAWAAGKPFPKRKFNSLSHHYMDRQAVGEFLGTAPGRVHNLQGIPKRVVLAGRRALWLKKEIVAYSETDQGKAAKAYSAVSTTKRRR
jgi:predicted DNA-binding transcriptional regulator AlpA